MDYPRVARAEQYAREIVAGRIPACKFVKQSVQRHLDNLDRAAVCAVSFGQDDEGMWTVPGVVTIAPGAKSDADYPFYFDPAAAERFLEFAENLSHVKGKWARLKETIVLEPWQAFIGAMIFGWLRRVSGFRRFREVYAEICRKNGKSLYAAIIGLYCFSMDGEIGAEVYCGATSEKQAWEVFRPAKMMLTKAEDLLEACGATVYAQSLVIEDDYSKFEPLIGKPPDGASPSLAIVDEYHQHDTPDMVDTMESGMLAREQPLLLIITTAGYNMAGPCYEKRRVAIQMLSDVIPREELFAIIFTIDETDDWTDPACLAKANPNFGVSIDPDILRTQHRNAVLNTSEQVKFKTKNMNVWCSARAGWLPIEWWRMLADPQLSVDELAGEKCYFALDLASKLDILAFIKTFVKRVGDKDHYYVFPRFYLPEAALSEPGRNQKAYERWAKRDLLTITEGAATDFERVCDDVIADARMYNPTEVVFDPFNATHASQVIANAGVHEVIEFTQNPQTFAVPMDDLKTAVKEGRYHHDGNELLTWMMSNVTIRPAKKGLFSPAKESAEDKIDGPVAMIMAHARATATSEPTVDDWLRSKAA